MFGMKHALLITRNTRIIETFERLAAVSQVPLQVSPMPSPTDIHGAFRIFIDDESDPIDSNSVELVVLSSAVTKQTWELAARTNAIHVATLPESEEWLLKHLIHEEKDQGRVVGFIPVVGGAGASYVAAATATLLAQRTDTAIIDADPAAGGIDLLFGVEQVAGTRWSDVSQAPGAGFTESLISALPQAANVRILSGSGEHRLAEKSLISVVDTFRQHLSFTVIDFARTSVSDFNFAQELCDELFLVATTSVRSCAVLSQLAGHESLQNMGLIIRQVPGSGLEALQVAAAANVGIRSIVPYDIKIVELVEQGLGFETMRMTPFVKCIKTFTNLLLPPNELSRAA